MLTDAVLMDEQGGFRVRRGCVDQLFAVREAIDNVIEKDKVVYAAFADMEKAYGSVSRSKLWVALKDYGVKERLLAAVQSFYEEEWLECEWQERCHPHFRFGRESGRAVSCPHGFLTSS